MNTTEDKANPIARIINAEMNQENYFAKING